MTIKRARTRSTAVEYFEYEGQARAKWPSWMQGLDTVRATRTGKIAVAHYDTPTGAPEFWRWFDADEFHRQFVMV